MSEIIRKAVVTQPVEMPETKQPVIFEVVRERVERFTIEQIDSEIASYNEQIVLLEAKKKTALALDTK